MRKIKTVLFDADGVLWVGQKTIDGAPEAITALKQNGIRVFIVTNNPTKTRTLIARQMNERGFKDINYEDIVSAGYATGQYLISKGFRNRKVFVVGEEGLIEELKINGVNAIGVNDFADGPVEMLEIPDDINAVVAALDFTLTYRKLAIGNRIIVENDALLIGTNCDNALPMGKGVFLPDAMPTILALQASSGRKATVLGKPSKIMFDPLRNTRNIDSSETLMVGDRLNTDVQFAKNIGTRSALVLTGCTTREDVLDVPEKARPEFICNSIKDIPNLVKSVNESTQ